jgi:pyruvate formate lyase activating enzyme
MLIKGWQKTSLIDFSPYTSSVVFLAGCNFRCGYCHNPGLVLYYDTLPDINQKEVFEYFEQKRMWVDGVCITGGEPTVHHDLPEFIVQFKKRGFKVKLDTNGTNPTMLKRVVNDLDYVAMDIKTELHRYKEVVNVDIDEEKIQQSTDLIRSSGVDYEFRTTVIPGIVGKHEIIEIGKWLNGSKKYVLQNFSGGKPLVSDKLIDLTPYSQEELEEMRVAVEPYFKRVLIRK